MLVTCSHTNMFCTLSCMNGHVRIKSAQGWRHEVLMMMAIGIIVHWHVMLYSQVDVY